MIQGIAAYMNNMDQMLRDAADDPDLAPFVRQEDLHTIVVTQGGIQFQAVALTQEGAKRIVQRILDSARKAGTDLKEHASLLTS